MFKTSVLPSGLLLSVFFIFLFANPVPVLLQESKTSKPNVQEKEETPQVPERVEVGTVTSDQQIATRLLQILNATNWFETPSVSVKEGVVFLEGIAEQEEYREWAGQLARNTQDVVAVVNRLKVRERSAWDIAPLFDNLESLFYEFIEGLPLLFLALVVLLLFWLAAKVVKQGAHRVLDNRIESGLLLSLAAKVISIPVFLLGLYLVLQIVGLTKLAVTVIGGTGLFGLILGIAFRDIMENFLASVLISLRRPFQIGDVITIEPHHGVVQKVTTRGTVIMAYDGNHIQIPNSTVYKSTIVNFTANPKRRMDFDVGIGYEEDIPAVQQVALEVMKAHPAVLSDPEPLILVEKLGAATVNLRMYFWFDGVEHNGPKVKSSLIRLVKRALEKEGFSMPDEAREVIFPQGVPVQMLEQPHAQKKDERKSVSTTADPVSTDAEGDLSSEDNQIREQARESRSPEEGEDLLKY